MSKNVVAESIFLAVCEEKNMKLKESERKRMRTSEELEGSERKRRGVEEKMEELVAVCEKDRLVLCVSSRYFGSVIHSSFSSPLRRTLIDSNAQTIALLKERNEKYDGVICEVIFLVIMILSIILFLIFSILVEKEVEPMRK